MRFKFCGDLDCPDWVLAEIATLSKITSVKMKLLCNQVIADLLGKPIDYNKVSKLTADAKYEIGDIKASIACLSFILSSAAKYSVSSESLSNELQQLGLPKEHSTSLCKSYEDSIGMLREELARRSLTLPSVVGLEWRVDYVLSSSHVKEIYEPYVHLRLKINDPDTGLTEYLPFTLTANKFKVFHHGK
ncbi:PREDICTED: COMM domain-containing protein 4-like [Priapulus caudatus]|uniref:COMM domain-containing protein 4-like n=1 Tax=Priapulus caudatus TaxID=37621 RepID=A0ABM1EV56_PRICU|nr:PREDICTED: COMM domain-containing protein 4-like [Priapulus caudatus]